MIFGADEQLTSAQSRVSLVLDRDMCWGHVLQTVAAGMVRSDTCPSSQSLDSSKAAGGLWAGGSAPPGPQVGDDLSRASAGRAQANVANTAATKGVRVFGDGGHTLSYLPVPVPGAVAGGAGGGVGFGGQAFGICGGSGPEAGKMGAVGWGGGFGSNAAVPSAPGHTLAGGAGATGTSASNAAVLSFGGGGSAAPGLASSKFAFGAPAVPASSPTPAFGTPSVSFGGFGTPAGGAGTSAIGFGSSVPANMFTPQTNAPAAFPLFGGAGPAQGGSGSTD